MCQRHNNLGGKHQGNDHGNWFDRHDDFTILALSVLGLLLIIALLAGAWFLTDWLYALIDGLG